MLNIKRHILLAPFTTFHIGGRADFFVEVSTVWELTEALDFARSNALAVFVMSGGSNLLVADQGFRGLVIRVTGGAARIYGQQILADAGAPLLSVVRLACEHELAGIERLAGIPGSLGGAIRGNAGAFGQEIGTCIIQVKGYDRREQRLTEYSRTACHFGYRTSFFKEHPEVVILSATLELVVGDGAALLHTFEDTQRVRESKHPQRARCAGSFFMNPVVKDPELRREFTLDTGKEPKDDKLPAGWLIDHVGLRGKKIGGAQVSPLHPNYLVNTERAKAEDIVMLASLVKQRVRSSLGVQLREEVQLVGF